jgi:hypothetical protein
MVNNKSGKVWLLGMVALVLSFWAVGCDNLLNGVDYTFEFRVNNDFGYYGKTNAITKIEFINGSSRDDPVLETITLNLSRSEMSNVYTVSGFSKKYEGSTRLYCVKLTFDDGLIIGKWASALNKSKILVTTSSYTNDIYFSDGGW